MNSPLQKYSHISLFNPKLSVAFVIVLISNL